MTEAAPPTLPRNEHNLVWIDLEMTGLDPATDRIIEIAVVVTDPQLTVRIEGPVLAVHQNDAALEAMDAWNKGTHGRSGLIDRVKASTVDEASSCSASCRRESRRCAATASARTGDFWRARCRSWKRSSTTATSTSAR